MTIEQSMKNDELLKTQKPLRINEILVGFIEENKLPTETYKAYFDLDEDSVSEFEAEELKDKAMEMMNKHMKNHSFYLSAFGEYWKSHLYVLGGEPKSGGKYWVKCWAGDGEWDIYVNDEVELVNELKEIMKEQGVKYEN